MSGFDPRGSQSLTSGLGKSWSLAARLTAWYAASSFLLVVLATVALYVALVQNVDREDVQTVRDK
jgi:hypothetical protein